MAADEDVAAGLLNWINSLEVAEPVHTIDDLNNEHIEPFAFPGSLPESPARIDPQSRESWISRWTNLKHIYDALSIFLVEECHQTLPIFNMSDTNRKCDPDLKAVAQHASLPDAILLVKLCVVSASLCSERISFLTRMQQLGDGAQKVLMETLQEAQEHEQSMESSDQDRDEQDDYMDDVDATQNILAAHQDSLEQTGAHQVKSDLAFEERLAKVIADNQRIAHEKRDLQRHLDDLSDRYDSLQVRFERGQDDLNTANDRLNALLSGRGSGSAIPKVAQETKHEALIAGLESKVADADLEIEELRKSNEVLRLKADRTQKLQDDYDEIKIERDKLARKANTAEKYRQKLETYQEMEKENMVLKTKVSDLQAQLRQSDSRTASSSDLQREVDEYRRLLPGLEQGRHELNEMKKRLEFDYHLLQARHSESEEQLRRSRQETEYLQGRLRDYDDGIEPNPYSLNDQDNRPMSGISLEQEEADFAAAEARLAEALLHGTTNEAGISKDTDADKIGIEGDDVSEDELRAIVAAMRTQMYAGTALERESGMKIQKRLVVMLEKFRSRNSYLFSRIQKQAVSIAQLQSQYSEATQNSAENVKASGVKGRLDLPKAGAELEQQLEEQDTLIENLKREIKLISSAWYEQNQRIATLGAGGGHGAVALMRLKGGAGIEEPRSFLGQQRKMLNHATIGLDGASSNQMA